MREKSSQKYFVVTLEMPKDHQRHIAVKAATPYIAGTRAMKRTSGAVKILRIERG